MEQVPTEVIENIAGHCDEGSLNSLTRTSSDINEKVNAYPSQVYKHIKRNQPKQLAQELLTMIDPAELITFQLDSTLDLDNLDKFTGDYDDYPFYLRFKLGPLELFSLSFRMKDLPDVNSSITELNFADEYNCKIVRENISEYMDWMTPTTNGGIWGELTSTNGYGFDTTKNWVIQFKPHIFDAIVEDLKRIHELSN